MIAIAESGSTKTDWVILDNNQQEVTRFKTQGYNPYFHSSQVVAESLNNDRTVQDYVTRIEQVYFYGAGCSSAELNHQIEFGLEQVFDNAKVLVEHDLLACAYALYDSKPVVACILGPGSNSCYFNGEHISENVPAMGFIMGDEGGGAYFGKRVVADYFYKKLPAKMQEEFTEIFRMTWNDARVRIYNNENANVYLASFMPFIAKYKDTQYVQGLVKAGFGAFLDYHVLSFEEAKNADVAFVGSIANIFRPLLEEELEARGLTIGKVIKSPIDELVKYHCENILNCSSKTSKLAS